MSQYIYKCHTPTFVRVLRYTDPGTWEYKEEHTDQTSMPSHDALEWCNIAVTPARFSPTEIKFLADEYRLFGSTD